MRTLRTGQLSLADFAADLHDVAMQKGVRPIYENPDRFFALTFPTIPLRELTRDVALHASGAETHRSGCVDYLINNQLRGRNNVPLKSDRTG